MLKGIIFDCFGVLYGGSAEMLRNSICPPDKVSDFDSLIKQSDYGYLTGDEYIDRVSELFDRDRTEIAKILNSQRVRNTELVEFARSLRPRYKVAMLSNISSGVMDNLITPSEQADWFDTVVLSSDVGMIKPSVEIFRYTAEQLSLAPEACVMIDDLAANCLGAETAGMRYIQYATNNQVVAELQHMLGEN